ncbi:MAG: hypothetical protein ACLTDR_10200 [Adlercreutzia equolifaciens]
MLRGGREERARRPRGRLLCLLLRRLHRDRRWREGTRSSPRAACRVPRRGYAIAYLYEVDDEGTYTFESEAAYIGEAPNFMAALKEPVAYADDEIDERYRGEEADAEGDEVEEDDAEEAEEVADTVEKAEEVVEDAE